MSWMESFARDERKRSSQEHLNAYHTEAGIGKKERVVFGRVPVSPLRVDE